MFGAEIKPYLKHINAWRNNTALPNRDIQEKLREIYDEWIKDERLPRTNLGCGGCVKHMMNQLVGAVDRLGNEPIKLEPKIPHLEPQSLTGQLEEALDEVMNTHRPIINACGSMTVEELRDMCDEAGIKYHHKAGIKRLTELLNESR